MFHRANRAGDSVCAPSDPSEHPSHLSQNMNNKTMHSTRITRCASSRTSTLTLHLQVGTIWYWIPATFFEFLPKAVSWWSHGSNWLASDGKTNKQNQLRKGILWNFEHPFKDSILPISERTGACSYRCVVWALYPGTDTRQHQAWHTTPDTIQPRIKKR